MRRSLIEAGLFDRSHKIRSDGSFLYLPILPLDEHSEASLRSIAEFELTQVDLLPEEHIPTPEEILGYRPRFDVVGDIALIEEYDEAEAKRVAAASWQPTGG